MCCDDVLHLCDAMRAFSLHRCRSRAFFSISIKYDISMFDNIRVFQASVFAAQAKAESDVCISMRYAL